MLEGREVKLATLEDLRTELARQSDDVTAVRARLAEDDGLALIESTLETMVERGGPGAAGLHAALGHVIMSRIQREIVSMEQTIRREDDN